MMARLFIGLIRLYQIVLSPLMGNQCRFHPTCSAYAIEAIKVHGAIKGGFMGLWRIMRCQPFSRGSWIDPVPPKKAERVGAQAPFGYNHLTQKCSSGCTHAHTTKHDEM
jgi:hypothetical protein